MHLAKKQCKENLEKTLVERNFNLRERPCTGLQKLHGVSMSYDPQDLVFVGTNGRFKTNFKHKIPPLPMIPLRNPSVSLRGSL